MYRARSNSKQISRHETVYNGYAGYSPIYNWKCVPTDLSYLANSTHRDRGFTQ